MATHVPNSAEEQLWQLVSISEYGAPSLNAKEGVASAWARLWRGKSRTGPKELKDPEPIPADELSHLVPELDLEAAARSLQDELAGWLERTPSAPRSTVIVGPPGSGVHEAVGVWARSSGVIQLAEPSQHELDLVNPDVLLPEDTQLPLVLPPLERLFLRRSGGLDTLIALLGRLMEEGRSFVAPCSSWSWAFLSQVLRGGTGFDRVLAYAPFDGAKLRSWLSNLAPRSIVLVDSRNMAPLLAMEEEPHEYLRSLAARARGIPGIAAALWGKALCSAKLGSPSGGERECIMPNLEDCSLPELSHAGKQEALVLHALLLHGALGERLLATVLPPGFADPTGLLWELHGEGILNEVDGLWSVTATGYPPTRAHLAAMNVPLDEF